MLSGIDLVLNRGDFLGVVGPNGAGKSTLLLGLLGVLAPRTGARSQHGDVRIGYVPQRGALDEVFPLTVRDVVQMGRDMQPASSPGKPVEEALAAVGLAELQHRRFRQLSGGQKQRVLLARALIVDPELLVLDEPTNGLDMPAETAIMEVVSGLHAGGKTIVLVTHLLNLVANHARTLAFVGDQTVITGRTDELMTPARLGAVYGMPVRVAEVDGYRVVVPHTGAGNGGKA